MLGLVLSENAHSLIDKGYDMNISVSDLNVDVDVWNAMILVRMYVVYCIVGNFGKH